MPVFFIEGDFMKKLQKLKSKKGGILDICVVVLITVLFAFAIILASMNDIGSINTNSEAHRIARNYMLKIESSGCLNSDDSTKLKEKLESIGLSNIDLSGTTMTKVNNGDDVYLNIHYSQTIKSLGTNKFKFQDNVRQEEIKLSSTAKN